jgi:tRNA threonylcarbamoyladenosine biosynthesis protein TsaE
VIRILNQSQELQRDQLLVETASSKETEQLGSLLAEHLGPGSIISLNGDLGAGKTTLVRGMARQLGCIGQIASPTFTLLREHPALPGGLPLFHFDAYRLTSADDFLALGLDEYFDGRGVCVIEWGDRIRDGLPERTIRVVLTQPSIESDQFRQVSLTWPFGDQILLSLANQIAGAVSAGLDCNKKPGGQTHADSRL